MSQIHEVAKAFNFQTEAYEQARPSYPEEALEFIFSKIKSAFPNEILPPTQKEEEEGEEGEDKQTRSSSFFDGIKILDLAAGTGKFTRLLCKYFSPEYAREHQPILAVEPAEGMRKTFKEVMEPWIPIVHGKSDEIPPSEGAEHYHIVTIAQAFHWFANIATLREVARVLKKGGAMVLIWNLEDDSVEGIKELRSVYERYDGDVPQYRKGVYREVFEDDEAKVLFDIPIKFSVRWMMEMDKEMVWKRVLSKSYISNLDEEEQQKVKVMVDDVVSKYIRDDGVFEMWHYTDVLWVPRL
jgi:SAM-dependent methyltransferase